MSNFILSIRLVLFRCRYSFLSMRLVLFRCRYSFLSIRLVLFRCRYSFFRWQFWILKCVLILHPSSFILFFFDSKLGIPNFILNLSCMSYCSNEFTPLSDGKLQILNFDAGTFIVQSSLFRCT